MLTQETKRKIDSARDILVGKVPDPKAQVEQITTALIYKFMDDMDKDAVELGGKARFFTNGYEQYAWTKLMDPKLGGHDRFALYADAIGKLSQNPHIPQLFRDIFKDAFLPYRSPETLNMFLKEINGFSYSHSEELGNSFEYLLSVLGSQGDAGQFRTPRHIIDFIVAAVDPKKDETVCDPACGTAGFLISAYKHILAAHDGKDDANHEETPLTPDEKKKLVTNLVGYDISPDMVKLSKVNMYLHGFADPKIYEYDTLSSEERWDETFDVMLANPPFMTPKGGIQPHKRFGVQANRAEVLFVDYIKEHLRPNGRAGVIVPEGIIFQSGKAYKALRKALVEDGLFAVASLPAGVFNPYAGVKTSILFLDNALAKKTTDILFIKVTNDGFDLGAQRRPVMDNGLPEALEAILAYRKYFNERPRSDEPISIAEVDTSAMCQLVAREQIAASGDYNLSGDRYRTTKNQVNEKWPLVELGEVCEINPKKSQVSALPSKTEISFVPMADLSENQMAFEPKQVRKLVEVSSGYTYFANNDVLLAKVTPCFENGKAGLAKDLKNGIGFGSSEFIVFRASDKILPELIYLFIANNDFRKLGKSQMTGTGGLQRVPIDFVKKYKIPLPPIEVQREIVEQIKSYQKIIDGARQVVNNWSPRIEAEPDWKKVRLGEVCEYSGGTQPPKATFVTTPREGYIRLLQIRDYKSDKNAVYIPISERHKTCSAQDIMIGRYGPPVFQILRGKAGAYNVALIKCLPDNTRITNDWLYYFLLSEPVQTKIISLSERVRQSGVRPDDLDELEVPLPPLEVQKEVVAHIEAERVLVESSRRLVQLYEQKSNDVISGILGTEKARS